MHVKAENYHVLDKPRRNVYTVKNMKTYMHVLKISFFKKNNHDKCYSSNYVIEKFHRHHILLIFY